VYGEGKVPITGIATPSRHTMTQRGSETDVVCLWIITARRAPKPRSISAYYRSHGARVSESVRIGQNE